MPGISQSNFGYSNMLWELEKILGPLVFFVFFFLFSLSHHDVQAAVTLMREKPSHRVRTLLKQVFLTRALHGADSQHTISIHTYCTLAPREKGYCMAVWFSRGFCANHPAGWGPLHPKPNEGIM